MKYLAALFIATVAISIGQGECKVEDVIRIIPSEVSNILLSIEKNLVEFNFSITNYKGEEVENITFRVDSPDNFHLDKRSIVNETLPPGVLNVNFTLVMPEVAFDGVLMQRRKEERTERWHRATFRSLVVDGNLTVVVNAYYNLRTKAMIIKERIVDRMQYVTDYQWLDCEDCASPEKDIFVHLKSNFINEFEDQLHRTTFKATPKLAEKLSQLKQLK